MSPRWRFRRRAGPPPSRAEQQETVVEGQPPPPRQGPPPDEAERMLWPGLLALLLLVIGGVLAGYFLTRGDGKRDRVDVPRVIGLAEGPAVARLERLGLDPNVVREFSSQPVGRVVGQRPQPDVRLERGAAVTLSVSRGPREVAVPNLVSLPEGEAIAQLTDAGLKSNVVLIPSTEPEGRVVAQEPVSGERVEAGATVRLNISKGPTRTTTVTTQTTTTAPPPPPTTTQGKTTTTSATVPDVTGAPIADAAGQMKSAGLLFDAYPVPAEDEGGTVVGQNPEGGASVSSGSVVRLNVSVGQQRPQVSVPDVTGRAFDEMTARQNLVRRGLTVRGVYRRVTIQGRVGVVLDQLPAAGTSVRRWAQVIIYVGRGG